jgi:hypothetical protein
MKNFIEKKIEDFSNQELPSLKAFQEASKELFVNTY